MCYRWRRKIRIVPSSLQDASWWCPLLFGLQSSRFICEACAWLERYSVLRYYRVWTHSHLMEIVILSSHVSACWDKFSYRLMFPSSNPTAIYRLHSWSLVPLLSKNSLTDLPEFVLEKDTAVAASLHLIVRIAAGCFFDSPCAFHNLTFTLRIKTTFTRKEVDAHRLISGCRCEDITLVCPCTIPNDSRVRFAWLDQLIFTWRPNSSLSYFIILVDDSLTIHKFEQTPNSITGDRKNVLVIRTESNPGDRQLVA